MTWRDEIRKGRQDAMWPTRITPALWPVCVLGGLWIEPRLPLVWSVPPSALLVAWQVRNLLRFPWHALWASMMGWNG